jgi:hypothetical protein
MHEEQTLVEPVSGCSVVVPVAGVLYTEVDDQAVLCRAQGRVVLRISPAAAYIWGLCDGHRSVDDIAGALDANAGAPDLTAVVELARRLRALGLMQDADGSVPAQPASEAVVRPIVRLRASVVPGLDGGGCTLRLGGVPGAEPAQGAVTIRFDGERVTAAGQELVRAEVEGVRAERLRPFEVFELLVQATDDGSFEQPGIADELASLAEAIPTFRVGS